MLSVALAVPAALQDHANRLSWALGYDTEPGHTYRAPLSASGTGSPTHYGTHTWAQPQFLALLSGAKGGSLPAIDWASFGLTEADVLAVAAAVEIESDGEPANTWPALLSRLGLQVINED